MNKTLLALLAVSSLFAASDESIDRFFTEHNRPVDSPFLENGHAPLSTPLMHPEKTQLSLPGFSAGIGATDPIQGGVGAANGSRMKESLASLTDGKVYAYLISLETVSPLLAASLMQIQSWANQLNATHTLATEIAVGLMPGMWPKTQRASAYLCELAHSGPQFKDPIEAQIKCRDDAAFKQGTALALKQNPQLLAGDYNVAAKTLSLIEASDEAKRLFLNITGTRVVQEKGLLNKKIKSYPPLYRQVIALLHSGREIEQAYFTKSDGFSIEMRPLTIGVPEKQKVLATMKGIQKKLLDDKEASFTDAEQKWLDEAPFPVGRLITLMTQQKSTSSALILERYSSLIAWDRVVQFVEESTENILHQALSLRAVQVNGAELDEYIEEIRSVLSGIQNMKAEHHRQIALENQAAESLIALDRELRGPA